MKWVEANNILDDEDDLAIFAKMKCRGGDFDAYTQSDFMSGGLPLGPAKHLFNAIQELIRSKDEGGHIIVASFFPMLFVVCCLLFLLSFILSCCG